MIFYTIDLVVVFILISSSDLNDDVSRNSSFTIASCKTSGFFSEDYLIHFYAKMCGFTHARIQNFPGGSKVFARGGGVRCLFSIKPLWEFNKFEFSRRGRRVTSPLPPFDPYMRKNIYEVRN